MLFEPAKGTFDGIVFAVIGRIIGQLDRDLLPLSQADQAMHELGASRVILGAVIGINDPALDLREARFDTLPPLLQTIDNTVCCQL